MNTKKIIELIEESNIRPNKKFGQNFLCNNGILEKIVDYSGITKNDDILEIGPGLGNLTEKMISISHSVTAIEIDSGLFNILAKKFKNNKKLNLVHDDFLKINPCGQFSKSISNLPYYCSSEILFKLAIDYKINEVYVMLQKEMAQRIISHPGTKNYGALSVTLGLYYESSILFNIDKKSFYPQPDIASTFLQLIRKKTNDLSNKEIKLFHTIVKSAFWGRRKTLIKTLSQSPYLQIKKDYLISAFEEMRIDNQIRGENLSIQDFKNLTKKLNLIFK